MHNQRTEYGKALVELGAEDQRIVVLEADLGKSTMSSLFQEAYPERYFEMGIAEQDMTGFAGGLALAGKVPFTNSFAVFAGGRAYDQIRQSIATANLHVVVVGSSAGLSDFGDGATHQSVDDLALMTAVPNMTVLTPCDGVEARLAVRAAVDLEGPVYLRLCRNDLEDIYPADRGYRPGAPVELRAGTDVALFAHGVMTHKALAAAELLEKQGVSASVVHMTGIKPVDEAAVLELARGKRGVVSCEEHSIRGGLSLYLAYLMSKEKIPVDAVAIEDQFGQSGENHEELLKLYGLTPEHIASCAAKLCAGGK